MARKPVGPLRKLRLSMGWRAVDVASASGVALHSIRRLEVLDVAGMKLGTLVRVAEAVGVEPCVLVPGLAARPARRSPLLPGAAEGSSRGG